MVVRRRIPGTEEVERVKHWMPEVSAAAAQFESRWTWLALRRVDPDLAARLHDQLGMFDQACLSGTADEINEHGAATVRGYQIVVRRLADASEPDDAYQLGVDPKTGCRVAVGSQRAALARVREIHGQDVIWITPDEVAALMASVEAFKAVGAVKQLFPGAEIIRRYQNEGCSDYPGDPVLEAVDD